MPSASSLKLLRTYLREIMEPVIRGSLRLNAPGNVRMNDPLGQRGEEIEPTASSNIVNDEEEDMQMQQQAQSGRQAATCLILAKDGKVLAVSRRNDPTDFGLPGGKVDPGETAQQAAARELQEETGLTATKLTPVFKAEDAGGYITTTFACEVEGTIETTEEGLIRWVSPDVLYAGSFGDYIRKLFAQLGR